MAARPRAAAFIALLAAVSLEEAMATLIADHYFLRPDAVTPSAASHLYANEAFSAAAQPRLGGPPAAVSGRATTALAAVAFLQRLAARPAVSPALRCVTLLTLFFFGIYLGMVCLRVGRPATQAATKAFGAASLEASIEALNARLFQMAEAMTLAPILCVLMITSRLRALQLDPGAAPEWHVQAAMYGATAAFLLRTLLRLAIGQDGRPHGMLGPEAEGAGRGSIGNGWGQDGSSWSAAETEGNPWKFYYMVAYGTLSLLLYVLAGGILLFGTLLEGDGTGRHAGGWSTGPPLSPMVRCTAAVAATYLIEFALLEALGGLRDLLNRNRNAGNTTPGRPGEAKAQGVLALAEQLEQLSLRFPIMVCVLLVGMELRAVQLRLAPDDWLSAAMYLTAASVIAQAASAGLLAVWRAVGTSPGGGEAGNAVAGEEPRSFGDKVTRGIFFAVWAAALTGLYAGTAAILYGVVALEGRHFGSKLPGVESMGAFVGASPFHEIDRWGHAGEAAAAALAAAAAPPLSVAMRCVLALTVVYFLAYLVLILAHLAQRRLVQGWVRAAQQAVAFAPMLCVLMISVRLRAMQLRVRDPPEWARATMYVATAAVTIQAICKLFSCGYGDLVEDEEDRKRPTSLAGKAAIIALEVLQNLAAASLYTCVALLAVALVLMEPAVA